MVIFKESQTITHYLDQLRAAGQTIGFVPTMGAIHAGHLSLVKEARKATDTVVCSIFVNPTQFNDPEDLKKYPVRTAEDIGLLTDGGTDILFLPTLAEIYPEGYHQLETYPFGTLEHKLEGAFRPGHFQGVAQVVARLLKTIHPDILFMGQKDFQQTLIIKELLNFVKVNTKLVVCPILRESDGLAMSSRNVRLSPDARKRAPLIQEELKKIKEGFLIRPLDQLIREAKDKLGKNGFAVEYLVVTDEKLNLVKGPQPGTLICLVAARIAGIRLIDNIILDPVGGDHH